MQLFNEAMKSTMVEMGKVGIKTYSGNKAQFKKEFNANVLEKIKLNATGEKFLQVLKTYALIVTYQDEVNGTFNLLKKRVSLEFEDDTETLLEWLSFITFTKKQFNQELKKECKDGITFFNALTSSLYHNDFKRFKTLMKDVCDVDITQSTFNNLQLVLSNVKKDSIASSITSRRLFYLFALKSDSNLSEKKVNGYFKEVMGRITIFERSDFYPKINPIYIEDGTFAKFVKFKKGDVYDVKTRTIAEKLKKGTLAYLPDTYCQAWEALQEVIRKEASQEDKKD